MQTARPINQPYAKNGFWEYLPPHYGNGFKRPLLVFWAGVGENGNGSANGLKVIRSACNVPGRRPRRVLAAHLKSERRPRHLRLAARQKALSAPALPSITARSRVAAWLFVLVLDRRP